MYPAMKKKHLFFILTAVSLITITLLSCTKQTKNYRSSENNFVQTYELSNEESLQSSTQNIGMINFTPTEPISYQLYRGQRNEYSQEQIIDMDMRKLTGLYKYLNKQYLWDIDYDAIYDAMATAMFETLGDQYSYYVKADNANDYEEETTGKYGGLGFYFSKNFINYQNAEDEQTLYCNVSQVFPNTPSARAGIHSGDMITHINGQDIIPLEATDCAKLIKGEPGSEVTVTIKRNGASFDVTMKREEITVPTVEYAMLTDKIAYMLILKFSSDTLSKVSTSLQELKKLGMKSLIIDLRDNPGGDVDVTLGIANYFIKDKDLLSVKYKNAADNVLYKASSEITVDNDVKIAILINGGTASSAEILSSALRDNGRATLIGTKTFGKGIMQIVAPYGNGYASITTASFIPPSGKEIHKIGVEPDIEVQPIIIEENEREAYKILLESKICENFVELNPKYTIANVEKFVAENRSSELKDDVLRIAVRNAYYQSMDYDLQPKADSWFDPQVKKAVEILSE